MVNTTEYVSYTFHMDLYIYVCIYIIIIDHSDLTIKQSDNDGIVI